MESNTKSLLEVNKRLLEILDGTRAGTWEWNVQTGETRFNARWAEIVGYSLEELQPISIDTWIRLTHPEDLAQSNAALQAHFKGETPYYECEARMKHKNGNWVWVRDQGKVVSRTPDGQPDWMSGSHIDITREKQLQESREKSLEQLNALSRHVPGMLYQFVLRPDGTSYYAYVSDRLQDVFGCDPALAEPDASIVMNRIHPGDLARIQMAIQLSATHLSPFEEKFRILHPHKGERWVKANSTPKLSSNGEIIWYGYSYDVSLEHSQEENMRVAANVFTHCREAILITDRDLNIIKTNGAYTLITGFTGEEVIGERPHFLRIDDGYEEQVAAIVAELNQRGHWQGELLQRRKSGEAYPVLTSINAVTDDHNVTTHYVIICSDISGIKKTEQELMRYANYDALTGLPNRRLLEDRLSQALELAKRTLGRLAICVLDIDGFKQVNDTHGHQAGDRLLQEVAKRLTETLRSSDTVARLGGDEFVLILDDIKTPQVLQRVLDAINLPVEVTENVLLTVSASIGITELNGREDIDGDSLLREADQALYAAKREGRNRFKFY